MIKLVVNDYEQTTILEQALMSENMAYEIELAEHSIGITPPYLAVDGVPLDYYRAMNWIKERKANE